MQRRGRKEKPTKRASRPRREFATPTWTTAELVARYHASRRTIRRWTVTRGFPEGWQSGREVVYSKVAVAEWERVNMPQLHVEPELSDEDKQWNLLFQRRQLEKAEEALRQPGKPIRVHRGIRI